MDPDQTSAEDRQTYDAAEGVRQIDDCAAGVRQTDEEEGRQN